MAVKFDIFFRGHTTSFEAAAKRVTQIGGEVGKKLENSLGQRIQGALSAAAVTAYGAKIVNLADEITDLSSRLEVSTQTLQEWGYAAERNGSKLETVVKFFEAINVAREKALGGDSSASAAFSRLGVKESTLMSGGASDIARQINSRFRNGGSSQELLGALKEVGGRGVGELIPTLKSDIDELAQAARDAGRIMDDEMLAAIKNFKSELQNVAGIFQGPMAKAIVFLSDQMRNIFDFTKIFVGGIGTVIGSILGGASWGEVKQITQDFMNSVADERLQRDRSIQAQADIQKQAEQQYRREEKDKIIDMEPKKRGGSQDSISATGWQRLGAAVRIAADNRQIALLQRIERNTAQTAERVRPGRADLMGGNFTGAFGP